MTVTTHAMLRFAQRVLGLEVTDGDLQGSQSLQARAARAIERIQKRGRLIGSRQFGLIVLRTRAIVVIDDKAVTLITRNPKQRFGKAYLRRFTRCAGAIA